MMVAPLRKANKLFAVNALSDRYFDSDKDRCTYMEVIEDCFAESGDEMEAHMEYEDFNDMC